MDVRRVRSGRDTYIVQGTLNIGGEAAPQVALTGRGRAALIATVRAQRIENGLERAVGHAVVMSVRLRDEPNLVKNVYRRAPALDWAPKTIEEAYDQAGSELLLVGPPGAGKTTQALLLMRSLLARADASVDEPVPELFLLPSWAQTRKPLLEWLADEVRAHHGYPLDVARALLFEHQIVPILDALDEVAADRRVECVAAINEFWLDHRRGPLVVCSRLAEYEDLDARLNIGVALLIEAPTEGEVNRYLAAAGPAWVPVRRALRTGERAAPLRDLLSTPLMLNAAVLAYSDGDPLELCGASVTHSELWSRYVAQMYWRRHDPVRDQAELAPPVYSENDVKRWLSWLAGEMRARDEAELVVHDWIGPEPFVAKVSLGLAMVVCGMISGLVIGLGGEAGLGMLVGFPAGALTGCLAYPFVVTRALELAITLGLILFLTAALVTSLVVASVGELIFGSGPWLATGITVGVVVGLMIGLYGAGAAVIFVGMMNEWRLDRTDVKGSVRAGLSAGLVAGLVGGFVVGPIFGPRAGLACASIVALVAALALGLGHVVYHLSWRLLYLRRRGYGPFRWIRFLDWCCSHLYLRSTGLGYQWVHVQLRDHLASSADC